jgi:hypothetical protein
MLKGQCTCPWSHSFLEEGEIQQGPELTSESKVQTKEETSHLCQFFMHLCTLCFSRKLKQKWEKKEEKEKQHRQQQTRLQILV